MAFQYKNAKGQDYFLHMREVKLRSGRMQTIYFFSKEAGKGAINELPSGFMVVENQRTGLPILKKKN